MQKSNRIPGERQECNMINDQMKKEAAACGAAYEKDGRVLVWHDEFDSEKLDPEKWCFKKTMSSPDTEYDNSEKYVRLENGELHMQVHKSKLPGKRYALCEGVCTMDTMNFRYGYLEIRANVPYRHGAWPSFWMKSNTVFKKALYMAEIDIYEVFSDRRNAVANLHKWGNGGHVMLPGGEGSLKRAYTFENFENLNHEYHLYGFEWTKTEMSFYIDGEKYTTFPIDQQRGEFGADKLPGMECFQDPAYPIFNNEIFTSACTWSAPNSYLTEYDLMPIDYRIDWIRLYQNPETDSLYLKKDIEAATPQEK